MHFAAGAWNLHTLMLCIILQSQHGDVCPVEICSVTVDRAELGERS